MKKYKIWLLQKSLAALQSQKQKKRNFSSCLIQCTNLYNSSVYIYMYKYIFHSNFVLLNIVFYVFIYWDQWTS